MRIKNFKDLIKEVHEPGICQQCGGCVSFCNSIENNVIGMKDVNSPPKYINEDKCLECGICYLVCPQTHILDDDLNKTYNFINFSSMPFGFIDNIYSCQSIDKEFLKFGTDGGVVNSLINYLLEKKVIDGAIVAKTKAPFSREAAIARNKKDLIETSGIKLDLLPQLDELHKFHTYTSSLPKLKQYKFKRLAVVGTPCQIYTIRCMQSLGIIPSQNIELCLGLFCYENLFFDELRIEKFEKEFNLKFEDIERINIKEDLIITMKKNGNNQKIIHIPFESINDYMRQACFACSDFTNIYADISFGGLGSLDKFTTVITRTKKGMNIIKNAINAGVIKPDRLDLTRKEKMKEKISKFCHMKIERFENFMKNKLITCKSPPLALKINDE
ncbi:MAG: Coenzyme F420 hydrogenase/dehydrogenase, beta subunit C-terminal domain [Candidatus Lokiarchaeota archaeon]|nr:Coenzyme F420 hydrogenase/dehydrogenase, beta subunit C-terminal domain [Candidatus Lokiarchaeota archaeon]